MTNQEFKERLEEILNNDLAIVPMYKGAHTSKLVGQEKATKSLTQLFQDFKDTVIGEEETYDDLVLEDNKMHQAIWEGRHTRNKHRQTQHQTANLILKGE